MLGAKGFRVSCGLHDPGHMEYSLLWGILAANASSLCNLGRHIPKRLVRLWPWSGYKEWPSAPLMVQHLISITQRALETSAHCINVRYHFHGTTLCPCYSW